ASVLDRLAGVNGLGERALERDRRGSQVALSGRDQPATPSRERDPPRRPAPDRATLKPREQFLGSCELPDPHGRLDRVVQKRRSRRIAVTLSVERLDEWVEQVPGRLGVAERQLEQAEERPGRDLLETVAGGSPQGDVLRRRFTRLAHPSAVGLDECGRGSQKTTKDAGAGLVVQGRELDDVPVGPGGAAGASLDLDEMSQRTRADEVVAVLAGALANRLERCTRLFEPTVEQA